MTSYRKHCDVFNSSEEDSGPDDKKSMYHNDNSRSDNDATSPEEAFETDSTDSETDFTERQPRRGRTPTRDHSRVSNGKYPHLRLGHDTLMMGTFGNNDLDTLHEHRAVGQQAGNNTYPAFEQPRNPPPLSHRQLKSRSWSPRR